MKNPARLLGLSTDFLPVIENGWMLAQAECIKCGARFPLNGPVNEEILRRGVCIACGWESPAASTRDQHNA